MKTFFITLLANVTSLLIVGAVGFLLGTQYVDSKLGPVTATIERVSSAVEQVSAVVETVDTKVEAVTGVLENSIGRLDNKFTDTETFQRFFPTK